jgi:hypothetical protein
LVGARNVARCTLSGPGTSPLKSNGGEPASNFGREEAEIVVPRAQPLLKTVHGSPMDASQKRQRRPKGKSRCFSCEAMPRACPSPFGKIHSVAVVLRVRLVDKCDRL